MTQLRRVSRERHGNKAWCRPSSYKFAATDSVAPLVADELSKAVRAMPIGFVEHAGKFILVAVMSVTPGQNHFVGPDGQWLGSYVPACLRSFPFKLVRLEGATEANLGIDEDSGLVVESNVESAEAFFDADGNITNSIKTTLEFLGEVERSRPTTERAVAALANAGVIQPWEIKVKSEGGEKLVTGLHRIDEAAFNSISDDVFLDLRKSWALPIAYAQLLSCSQIAIFEQLNQIHKKIIQARQPQTKASNLSTLDAFFSNAESETLKFD